jgi:16S rRNA G966 N2-methylase RsmD
MTRRALTNVGGPVRLRGDPELSAMLAKAWERAEREPPDVLTHGFHSWPARMHWAIARTVLEALEPRSVLDPFCGGGTVLIEARRIGARALGVDLNPLARRVCEVKLDARDANGRARLIAAAEGAAERSEARVRARVPIVVALPKRELVWYEPHVLKELGGLLEEIRAIDDARDREALEIVFSSIVVKVSRQRADTSEQVSEKRIRKGLTTELFLRKARELAARLEELENEARGPMPRVIEGDARKLSELVKRQRFDLVLTSPPYGGTYDYAAHHTRRITWLGLDSYGLRRRELGSRRSLSGEHALELWEKDVSLMLSAMASVLRPGGRIVLVIGDADIEGERVSAPPQLARLAPRYGLHPTALASQERRDHRGAAPRREHLAMLTAED